MTSTQTDVTSQPKPIRLWPGVIAVVLQWLLRFGVPLVAPQLLMYSVLGGLVLGLVIIVWWAFFSRVPHLERWSAVVLVIVALLATPYILHKSIATGMMGMMFLVYAVPVLSLALVVWALASRHLSVGLRRVSLIAVILIAGAGWALVRTGGLSANLDTDFAWRWSETPEQRLLAQAGDQAVVLPSTAPAAAESGAEWPGFRGSERNSVIHGVRIETDWSASSPVELWRRPIGPGWSSFAVHGARFYTQEQRGDDELVACYHLTTGEPVWRHSDAARFWESNAGAGPRATPTLGNGRVYTLGATGILNVLDADTGVLVWSRDVASDTGIEIPIWGFSGSPLVTGELVIVAAAGTLVAYDLATGDQRWSGADGGVGYSSPQLLTLDGVEQVLLQNANGVISVVPGDGSLLWEYQWQGYPIVQPALTADGDLLACVSQNSGIRRLAVSRGAGGWTVAERWTSQRLEPYFNDYVIHRGHAYGFDNRSLACLDLADGERRWKGKRYGNGQLILVADQDLLLVLSEKGELALVEAVPERFTELARVPAIEGKTWNHPVLAGDVLLVRNAQEMAAFRLALATEPQP